jgi:hypothetical protein
MPQPSKPAEDAATSEFSGSFDFTMVVRKREVHTKLSVPTQQGAAWTLTVDEKDAAADGAAAGTIVDAGFIDLEDWHLRIGVPTELLDLIGTAESDFRIKKLEVSVARGDDSKPKLTAKADSKQNTEARALTTGGQTGGTETTVG